MSQFPILFVHRIIEGGDSLSKLIINERPLLIPPTLAEKIGLNEAIVLQQVHFWLTVSDKEKDGKRWVYNTYEDWQRQFPFWSRSTIIRIFNRLEDAGYVESANYNTLSIDRTKWYTINYDLLNVESTIVSD